MNKLFVALLLVVTWFMLLIRPVQASDSWKSLPPNTCPPYPTLSACNLNYITETNVATLTSLLVGGSETMASGIGFLYKVPPVSGHDFITYMSSRFHIPGTPTPAYAANPTPWIGGYNSLGPVLKIWVAMRNLAYLVFAILFVVIGVMIMIRSKLDPKTTINIQNALPKIVVALILVTFSYAIAGFLIDLMYVALALVITITGSIDTRVLSGTDSIGTAELGTNILSHNLFWGYFNDGNMWDAVGNAGQAISTLVKSFVSGAQDQGITGPLGSLLGGIVGGVAALIIAVAILFALFKTWLSLLSAYANIILGIIFSPIQLMMDAIPGQSQFDGWIRNMLANILSFPAVLAMILIGLILAKSNNGATPGLGFSPPLIGNSDQQAIQSIIGIAIILTIPKVVEMVQEAIKAPKQKFGSAWGESMAQGQRVLGGGATQGWHETMGKLTEESRLQEEGYQKQHAAHLAGQPGGPGVRGSWLSRQLNRFGGK